MFPLLVNSQIINQINITDSIFCDSDPECIDIELSGLSDDLYHLYVFKELSENNLTVDNIIENVTNDSEYFESTSSNSGIISYCFETNGEFIIQLIDENETTVLEANWETMTWPPLLEIDELSSQTFLNCNGDSNGSLKVFGTGGFPPLTYSWQGPNGFSATEVGVIISEITDLSAGNYFLTLTDANGCENNSFTGTISEPSDVTVDININSLESCYNSSDAQITANASGGNGIPYSYVWDSGEITASITTGSGSHSVTVSDSKGCEGNELIVLQETSQLLVNNTIVNDALCFGSLGTVSIDASGGTGQILYNWPNGISALNSQDLLANEYFIDVIDENGCVAQANFSINQPDSLELSLNSINDAICYDSNDGVISFNISGGNPNYTILFDGENSLPQEFSNINSAETSFQTFGADDYQISITDENNCNLEYPQIVSLSEASELTVLDTIITNVQCYGESTGSIEVTIGGGYGQYLYSWTDQTNAIIGTESIVSDLTQGTYTLTVNDSICSKIFSFEILQADLISYLSAPTVNNVSCFGANDGYISGTIIQGGNSPYQYNWNTIDDTFNVPNPSSLEPGQYFLDVTDSLGCEFSFPMVEISEPLELTFHPNSIVSSPSCLNLPDGFANLYVVGGVPNYTYTLEEITSGLVFVENEVEDLPAGEYIFSVIDSNGCELDSSFIFDNPDDLVFNAIVNDLNCYGSNDGFLAYSYEEVIEPYTIYFEGDIQANDTVFGLAAGTYTSVLMDGNGCTKTIVETINQPDILSYISSISAPSCNEGNLLQNSLISNGSINLEINGGSGYYDIIINDDTTQTESGITAFINNLSAGSYDIDVVDSQGCILSFNENVDSPLPINVYENITDIVVFGDSTGAIDISITGGQSPFQFSWLGPSFVSDSQNINNLSAGIYTLTVIDANGCYEIYEYAVNQDDCNIQINTDVIQANCFDDNASINFELFGGLAPYNCFMQGDIDSDGFIDEVLPNTQITSTLANDLVLPAGTEYTLLVEDEAECLLTYNFVIPKKDSITISADIIDASCYGFNDGKIIIDPLVDIEGGTPPYSIEWLGLDLNPVDPYTLYSGQYIVKVTDFLGCSKIEYFDIDEPTQITLFNSILNHTTCIESTNLAASNGSISVVAQGGNTAGTGLYQYSWSNDNIPSLQNIEDLSAGSYSVIISDQTNCSSEVFSFEILSPQFIEYDYYTTEPISCNNSCDGSISVFTNNTSTDLFYWYDASDSLYIANSNTISDLCSGNYYFAIENEFNCYRESPALGIGNITLNNPDEFLVNIVQSPSIPNGICNGIASITSTTGVGNVSFEWSTGQTTSTVESLCGNVIYQVTASDENGCQSFNQFSIDEDECAFEIGNLEIENISCTNENDGKIYSQNIFQGGYPPYTQYLYMQDVLIAQSTSNSNQVNFSSLSQGEYFVIVEDAGGCIDTYNATITNPSPISYSYSIENNNCYTSFNPEVHITISGGTPFSVDTAYDIDFFGFEYYVSFEEEGIEYYVSGDPLIPGNYPLIVSDSNDCTSPLIPSSEIFIIEVDDINPILVDVQTFSPECQGDSNGVAILSYNGGIGPYEINWYIDGELLPFNDSLTVVEDLSSGNYYVSVKDVLECETIHSFEIIDIEGFFVETQLSTPSCVGASDGQISTEITGSNGGYNFLWSPGSMISNNIFGLSSGDYDLIITDTKGCVHIETILLNDPNPIVIDLDFTPITCFGEMNGTLSAIPSSGAGNYNYQWYVDGLPISALNGGISPEIINLGPANYSVEVSDALNCSTITSFEMSEPDAIEVDFEIVNPTCLSANDGSVVSTITGGSGSYTYNYTDMLGIVLTEELYYNQFSAGTYNFNVTDTSGCILSTDFSIENPNPIDLTIDIQDVVCYSDNNGAASLTIEGGQSPYTINWYEEGFLVPFNDSTLEISSLSFGNYSVKVKDALNCEVTLNFTINNASEFSVDYLITSPSCVGSSDASISTEVFGGNGSYEYLWSPGSMTTSNVSNLSAGEYSLIITDENDCNYLQTFIIEEPEEIEIEINTTEITCHGFTDGSISSIASFGSGNYTYQWYLNGEAISIFDGGISPDIVDLSSGIYSIEVTDALGCSSSTSVELSEPSLIEISMEVTYPTCFGSNDGQLFASVSGGTGVYSYELINESEELISETNFSDQLYSGTYEFVVQDTNSCQVSSFHILENPDPIQLTVDVDDVSCYAGNDARASFEISNNNGSINHTWSRVLALNQFDAISYSDTLSGNITQGNYVLEVIDSVGCSQSNFFSVEQPDSIEIAVIITPSLCSNISGAEAMVSSVNAAEPVNYVWTINQENNISQFGEIATDLNSGIIYLNGNDANGCALPLTIVNIPESTNPLIQVEINQSITNNCYQDSNAELEAVIFNDDSSPITTNVLYQWYFNGNPILGSQGGTINILSDLGPGIYYVEVIDENLGCVNSDTIELFSPEEIIIELETQNIDCFGDDSGTALATLSNATLPIEYHWNNSMDLAIDNDVFNPLNLVAGLYELTVIDANGCQQSEIFEILQNDELVLDLNSQMVSCFDGDDGILYSSVVGGFGNYNYEWRNEANEIVSISTSASDLTAQNYSVTISDELGCTVSETVTLDQPNDFEIQANIIDVNCYGNATGSVSLNVTGGTGELSYNWDIAEDNSDQIINLSAGTYSVTIADEIGCQLTESFLVEQSSQLTAEAEGIFQSCTEGILNITSVNGGTPPYDYLWLDDPSNETMSISGLTPGYHTFIITDAFDCILIDSALISGANEIFTSLSTDSVQCNADSSGTITVSIINDNNYPYYYSVNDASSFSEMIVSQTFIIDHLPVGDYTIFIKDGENCIDTTEQVSIFEPTPLELAVSSSDVFCHSNQDGLISIQSSGGIAPYNISLDGGNTFSVLSSQGNESLNVYAGEYNLLISDQNSCTLSQIVSINQPDSIIFSLSDFSDFSGYNNSCYNSNDASLKINLSGGLGDLELSYLDTSLIVTDGIILENMSQGDYSFVVSDSNLCTTQIDTIITAPDTLSFSMISVSDYNGTNTSCFGVNDAFLLSAVSGGVGPFDYSFNGGVSYVASNTVNEYQFENLGSGLVTFQVKDNNECIANFIYEITSSEDILPSLSIYAPINCNGNDEGTLLAQFDGGLSNFIYHLSNLEDTISIESSEISMLFENISSGFYELNVTDANGCSNDISNASQINLNQPAELSYEVNVDEISCNSFENGVFELYNLSGGVGSYSIKLYSNLGYYFEDNNLGNFDFLSFDSLTAASYILIITDENDCNLIDTLNLDNPDELSALSFVENVDCFANANGYLELTVDGGSEPYTLSINNENYNSSDLFTVENLGSGVYSYQLIDANGCSLISEVTISQPDSIIIEPVIVNNICFGQSHGSIDFNVSGGVTPYLYQFTDANGILISDSNSVNNLSAASYYIMISDSNGCAFNQEVVILEPIEISIEHEIVNESCPDAKDASIISFVSDFQDSYEVFWSDNELSGLDNSNISPGQYIITIVDNFGCFKIDTLTVEKAESLDIYTSSVATECSYTNDGSINIDFAQIGSYNVFITNGIDSYADSISNNTLQFDNLSSGEYSISINYNSNCILDTVLTIDHEDGYNCIIPEPTFSPNFDGLNDVFKPVDGFDESIELIIFNRWGAIVFNQESFNPAWDGTDLNGNLVPSADYYYILKFNNTLFDDITGIITLLK